MNAGATNRLLRPYGRSPGAPAPLMPATIDPRSAHTNFFRLVAISCDKRRPVSLRGYEIVL
jgi:hypothetical protein